MKLLGKASLSSVIKVVLQILFAMAIVLLIILPGLFYLFMVQDTSLLFNGIFLVYPIFIYFTGFPALMVVYQFIKLFRSLKEEKPFVEENAKALQVSSICSAVIAIFYLPLGILSVWTHEITLIVFTSIIFLIFVVAWIGLAILSLLFKQAVEYKKENDLTI